MRKANPEGESIVSEPREADCAAFQEGVALMADALRGTARRVPAYAQMH